jgi:hypothetical protein
MEGAFDVVVRTGQVDIPEDRRAATAEDSAGDRQARQGSCSPCMIDGE